MKKEYVDRGYSYMHGLNTAEPGSTSITEDIEEPNQSVEWHAGRNGRIPCAPKELDGCGSKSSLELKRIFPLTRISDWK